MDERVKQLLAALKTPDEDFAAALVGNIDWVALLPDEDVQHVLQGILEQAGSGEKHERLIASILRQLVARSYSGGDRRWNHLSATTRSLVEQLYRKLGSTSASRHLLLQALAASRGDDELKMFAELMATDPPSDPTAAAVSFGPFFRDIEYSAEALFPRLLDGLDKPNVAAAILDLSNYVTREGLVDSHPAASRQQQLETVLSGLVRRLGIIEERPESVSDNPRELSAIVSNSVSLVVALCDALGLIGDPAAIGKLNQVLELRHRRLRTEAAAALARLNDENGRQVLLSLLAEPVSRLRVLAYAAELGIEEIDEKYATPAARAESALALWLSEPTQLGFPPSQLELIDSRTMYWPSFDEPVDCFLFRFTYEMSEGEYSGIGISGPMCHAFAADLADLPPDDIYAIFAGWQAEHEEIYEFDANHLSEAQRVELARLERRLRDHGCEDIHPVTMGFFFGERLVVARAVREGQQGIAVASNDDMQWLTVQARRRPLGPQEAHNLFKGRRLLRAFNPEA